MRKLFVPLLAMGMVVFTDVTFAAFGGSRGSSGVSRSYSRPATTTYSKPTSTYKAPSYSTNRQSSSYSSGSNNSNSYSDNSYRRDYDRQPIQRQTSAMRDIGVTAAGVAGGVLAASAITALVSSPGHAGMYTHPQYPGQYFNQQGMPMAAPAQQAPQAAPQQYQQQYQQPQPYVVVQQPQEPGLSFFGILWGALWFLLKLAFFLSVVGAIGYGIYKLVTLGRNKEVREKVQKVVQSKVQDKFSTAPPRPSYYDELDSQAMEIFYDFQKNSDNSTWVTANTKYLPVEDCLAPVSKVLTYQHKTIDCVVAQGKVRGTVLYEAKLDDGTGAIHIEQCWNFEKDGDTWKLIGIEQDD